MGPAVETESRTHARLTRAFRILIDFCAAMVVTLLAERIFETQLTPEARNFLEGLQQEVDASLALVSTGNLSDAFSAAWSSVHEDPNTGFLALWSRRMVNGTVGMSVFAIAHGGVFGVLGCALGAVLAAGLVSSLSWWVPAPLRLVVALFGVCVGFGLVILLLHVLQLLLAALLSTAASAVVAGNTAFSKTEHWADHRLAHFAASAILGDRPR